MIVAFLGAGGTMGLPMARNLLEAGHEVRAWNRTPDKARSLTGDGATIHATPAQAAQGADAVVTMVSDADAVLDVMRRGDGALGAMRPGDLWVQMSTIGLDGTERAALAAAEREVAFVDAPVLGTREPAERGELVVLASGPADARARAETIFDAVGRRSLWLGDAGAGTRLKLVTNAWILAVVEGAAEAIALAQGLDVDPDLLLEAVAGGPLDLPYLQRKGRAMIDREFAPSFRLTLAAKDAELVARAAARQELELPLVTAVAAQMRTASRDHGDEDMAATYWASAPGGHGPSQLDPVPDA